MAFPRNRMRRLRAMAGMRLMVRETTFHASNLIAPIFVDETLGEDGQREVPSMPGVFRLGLKRAVEEAESLYALGVPAVILFGIPNQKDAAGEQAWDASGIVQRGLQQIGAAVPDLVLIADACFCEYTDHGHCGVLTADGRVDNDPTLANLQRAAVAQAAAGAHIIAPSGMMDGMVQAIRAGLDEAGYQHVAIMAYAAKYASAFYGPFRDAADSAPAFGDRRQYQMDPANSREALREVQLDLDEGADIVMVKPALAYLDIVRQVREQANVPVAAYNVSGEYAMAKAAAQAGWVDEKALVLETMTAMRRAGADLILTYWARDIARWLSEGSASS